MAPTPPAEAIAPPARRRRWPLFLGLGLFALAIVVRVVLPELLRRTIESQASQALGRKVELADVDLGLLAGRVGLEGLAVGGPDLAAPVDAQSAVIQLAHLGAQIDWLPLLSGKIRLKEIALALPMLRLDRTPEGGVAPLVLAESKPEPELPKQEPKQGGGLDLAIAKLSLDRAQLRFVRQRDADSIAELRFENLTLGDLSYREDTFGIGAVALRGPDLWVSSERISERAETPAVASPPPSAAPPAPAPKSAPSKHHVEDLNIENARFAWRLPDGEAVQAELDIHASKVGLGAELFPLEIRITTDQSVWHLKGELAVAPVAFDGRFDWEGVRMTRLALLVSDAPVKLATGTTDGSLQIALHLAEDDATKPASVKLEGDASVSDLDLITRDGAVKLRWKKLAAEIAPFQMPLGGAAGAPALHLTRLTLDAPELEYTREAVSAPAAPAPAQAAPAAQPAEAASATAPAAQPDIEIDALELNDGSLRFRDHSVKPEVDTALRELRIRAQGIDWPERDVEKLELSAKGQRSATLKLDGGMQRGQGGFDLELAQLPLAPFDPYAGGAAGLQIQDGRLSLKTRLTLGAQSLGAKSQLSLHQLSLSERESGVFHKAFGMPLDVAIALLQDMQGDITLPVDVEQDAGGTHVGVREAVTAALRQALVGSLAAPLKLLGAAASKGGELFGGGVEPIPMRPGAEALSAEAQERVAALARLLGSRPGLHVLLVGRADASDDPSLARRELLAKARSDEPLPGEDQLGFFERRRVRHELAEADPEQLAALSPETAAALDKLAAGLAVTDESRETLALARAQAVAKSLQEEHGASADAVAEIQTEMGAPAVEFELRAQ